MQEGGFASLLTKSAWLAGGVVAGQVPKEDLLNADTAKDECRTTFGTRCSPVVIVSFVCP